MVKSFEHEEHMFLVVWVEHIKVLSLSGLATFLCYLNYLNNPGRKIWILDSRWRNCLCWLRSSRMDGGMQRGRKSKDLREDGMSHWSTGCTILHSLDSVMHFKSCGSLFCNASIVTSKTRSKRQCCCTGWIRTPDTPAVPLDAHSLGSGSRHRWIKSFMSGGHSSENGSLFGPVMVGFSLVTSSLSTCTHAIVIQGSFLFDPATWKYASMTAYETIIQPTTPKE